MNMNKVKSKTPIYKKLSLLSLALCGLCCTLPVIGIVVGVGSLSLIGFYLEKLGLLLVILTILSFLYSYYSKKKVYHSCDINCNCKNKS